MTYIIKCPNCGFEYSLDCNEKDWEEIQESIIRCPCGSLANVEVEE